MEFVALKKNYITLTSHVEDEKDKQKRLGVELINLRNENQQLNEDQNIISREKTNLSKEQKSYVIKIERLENQNQKYRLSTIEMKAEIERQKTKMIEYDLKDQQYKIELDTKKIQMERGFMQMTKEQQIELKKMGLTTNQKVVKMEEQKRLWQSEKIELVHKNKTLQRKVNEMNERGRELVDTIEELTSDNTKI